MLKTLTVQEYANLKGVSHVTVYRWIEKNKVKYTVEHSEGKDIKKILVDDNELLSNNLVSTPLNSKYNDVSTPCEKDNIIDVQPLNQDNQSGLIELLSKMYEDNKQLSEYVGKTKLLTDSEHRTKEQYFETIQENKRLMEDKIRLEVQLENYQKKLEELEEKNKIEHNSNSLIDILRKL